MSQKTKSSSIVYDWHRQDARITECEDVACTVNSNYGTGGNNVPMTITERFVVRRLTPKECERLQGFPDDWTNIGDWTDSKGKNTSVQTLTDTKHSETVLR